MRRQQLIKISVTLMSMLATATVVAHIKNEATQFPDIEFSDARFDIVMLVGAGIIPQTPVFEPDKPLSMAELATWAALARGLGPGGETPDTTRLAQSLIDAGLIESLEGDATYADINTLVFDGALTIEGRDSVPTKAEAARFIASYIHTEAAKSFLTRRDLALGATGEVTAVVAPEAGRGYVITIGDVTLPMDIHGRVANGPTDLFQWEGRYVTHSFVQGSDAQARWTFIEAGEPPTPEKSEAATASAGATAEDDTAPSGNSRKVLDADSTGGSAGSNLLTYLIIAVVLLGALLFFQGRRKG